MIHTAAFVVLLGIAPAAPDDGDAAVEQSRAFAKEHHPEMARLLDRLERSSKTEFRKAIASLNKQRVRLEKLRERSPKRYKAELERWKLDSRIRLATARAGTEEYSARRDNSGGSVGDDARQELKDLLVQRAERRLATLQADRAKLEERLKTIDEQILRYSAETSESPAVTAEYKRLIKAAVGAAERAEKKRNAVPAAPKGQPKSGRPKNSGTRNTTPKATDDGPKKAQANTTAGSARASQQGDSK